MQRIVLAYSGGLDASVAIRWLAETCDAEVIAVTMDLGQGENLEVVRERAIALGAASARVVDLQEEFARGYILPALQAGATGGTPGPLAAALTRPLIASALVEIARLEKADAVAHACAGGGDDQLRLDISIRALDPSLTVYAPRRVWGMTAEDKVEYARVRGLDVPPASPSAYTIEENLWGRSIACAILEDPWNEPPEAVFSRTRPASRCPDLPACLELAFEAGVPVSVNDVPMPLAELVHSVATIAGVHGVGRIDTVEDGLVGLRSREVYEAPAAVVLHAAYQELETLVSPRDLVRLKRQLGARYADLVREGLWFTPTRQAIDAFVATMQPRMTGQVRIRLCKGECRVVGRRSPFARGEGTLTAPEPVRRSVGAGDEFRMQDAENRMQNVECRMQNAKWRMPRAECPF